MNHLGVLTLLDFVEFFPKIIGAAYPFTALKLLKHHFHKTKSTKCSVLTVIILEFGSIARMHSPFQNKIFQVYLSGIVLKKKTHAAKMF